MELPGFAALLGLSIASASTMGRVSCAEMKRRNYDAGLATGTIAAGGRLGDLPPPSTGFVIYAILTEESIGRLFIAGIGQSSNPYMIMIANLAVYAILAMVIEGLSLMVITLPIIFPVVVSLGFDPI